MEILTDHPIVKDEKKTDKIKSDRSKMAMKAIINHTEIWDCIWGELGEKDRENITEFIEQKRKKVSQRQAEGKDFGVGKVKSTEEMQKMTEVITKKNSLRVPKGKDEKDNIVAHNLLPNGRAGIW